MKGVRLLIVLAFVGALQACGGTALKPAGPGPDAPVPASEPRQTLHLKLDLEHSASCEEDFDLAIYENRGVELLQWDEQEGCRGRQVSVRYYPEKLSRQKLLKLVRELAVSAKETQENEQ